MAHNNIPFDARNITEDNARTKIIISGSGISITAQIRDDISIAGGNQWGSVAEGELLSKVAGAVTKGTQLVSQLSDLGGNKQFANVGNQIQALTAVKWNGAAKPTFTLPLTFSALHDGDDIRKKVLELYKTVYPSRILGRAGVLKAPLGYSSGVLSTALGKSKGPKGVLTIQVGKWLRFRKCVMGNVDFSFSKEALKSGKPLKAIGSITFEPYRAITYNEIRSYIMFGGR